MIIRPDSANVDQDGRTEALAALVSRADEWIALTDPPEIAALNVRGFAVWLDLKRKTQPAEGRCLCGGPWPCPDQDAPNYRSEAYAPHGLAQPAAPAEGLRLDPNSPEDVERLAQALCRRDGYVWTNEPEWQREEWKANARSLLRVLYDIDRERAALEANHE